MLSSSDLPACSACGSREVQTVHKYAEFPEVNEISHEIEEKKILQTFYACAGCGRDVTDAWTEIQPPAAPEKAFADLPAAFDQEAKERHFEDDAATAIVKHLAGKKITNAAGFAAGDPPRFEEDLALGIGATVGNGGES